MRCLYANVRENWIEEATERSFTPSNAGWTHLFLLNAPLLSALVTSVSMGDSGRCPLSPCLSLSTTVLPALSSQARSSRKQSLYRFAGDWIFCVCSLVYCFSLNSPKWWVHSGATNQERPALPARPAEVNQSQNPSEEAQMDFPFSRVKTCALVFWFQFRHTLTLAVWQCVTS